MLSYNELKVGTIFELSGQLYEVLSYEFLRMQQRKPVAKTKIKNLITGQVLDRNFHQNESFSEAEVDKQDVTYLYNHREEYWFCEKGHPKNRFSLTEKQLGAMVQFLKQNSSVTALKWGDKILNIKPPIKVDLEVTEAPPAERGNTAQGGTKQVTLETGAKVNTPMFISAGDIIRVNTETGNYVERVKKSS